MKYIVSVSGGKDSTACLLYMLERVPKNDVIPVFCDTKWESNVVYKYLDYLEAKLDIHITRLESEGMEGLCKRKGIVISSLIRNCTLELKIKPFEKYLKEQFVDKGIEFMVVEGIRREESQSRADTEVFNIKKSTIKGEKFYKPTLYPIAYWNTDEVFNYIESKDVLNNPLYKTGRKRVGCMPCVFASKYELMYLPEKYKNRLKTLEKTVGEQIGKEAYMFHPKRQKYLEPLLFKENELFLSEEEMLKELEKEIEKIIKKSKVKKIN